MSNYPKADAIIEELFKDKTLLESMIVAQSTERYYSVYSGLGNVNSFSKLGSLELNINGIDYYIPCAGSVESSDFPDLKKYFKSEIYERQVIEDKELIDKILSKVK